MVMVIVSQISVPSEFLSFKSHVERCQPVQRTIFLDRDDGPNTLQCIYFSQSVLVEYKVINVIDILETRKRRKKVQNILS